MATSIDTDQSCRQIVLITGAASGLGKCFAQHYLQQVDTLVFTIDLNPATHILHPSNHDQPRQQFQPQNQIDIPTDLASLTSIKHLVSQIQHILHANGKQQKLDLIIHSAGIRGLVPSIEAVQPHDVAAAETFQVMNSDTMLRTYQINTLGTFNLLQNLHFADLFHPARAGLAAKFADPTISTTKIIVMTSRMGSVSHAASTLITGGYAYRASKAALNSIINTMSIDLPHVLFALVHPGRVETGLTKRREEGAIEVDESVKDMLSLIGRLSEDFCRTPRTARFLDRFGREIGW